jgi:hypothetical protein
VTELTAMPLNPGSRRFFQNLVGSHTFDLVSLSLAGLVFALGRLTVYAADKSESIVYTACAIAISQCAVTVLLSILGRPILHVQSEKLRLSLVVTLLLLANVFGTVLFEAILFSWNFDPIPQSIFQRAISLLFTTFIYLGFGLVRQVLDANFMQVKLAKGLLEGLSSQQLELTQEIRDSRTYSIREISLEIQSTIGTLDNFATSESPNQELAREITELETILKEIEVQSNQIANRFPGTVRMPKIYSKVRYSSGVIISASTKPNETLPVIISVVAFFGFSSWLSFFMDELHAGFWGTTLSALSYGIFFAHQKYVVTKLQAKSLFLRILVFEILVITYLFLWLLILGFFAGDNSASYGAALAYAAIPFIFFNGGAVLGGVIISSQEQREQLTKQAFSLRKDLAELEQIRNTEDKVWKSLFAGDIALSPTTASVILRDATMTKEHNLVALAVKNVITLWNSVLVKISNLT